MTLLQQEAIESGRRRQWSHYRTVYGPKAFTHLIVLVIGILLGWWYFGIHRTTLPQIVSTPTVVRPIITPAPITPVAVVPVPTTDITVERGMTFSELTEQVYQHGREWFWRPLAQEMNIPDPNKLAVGQVLHFPRPAQLTLTFEGRTKPGPVHVRIPVGPDPENFTAPISPSSKLSPPSHKEKMSSVKVLTSVDTMSQLVSDLYGDNSPEVTKKAMRVVIGASPNDHQELFVRKTLFFPKTLQIGKRTLYADVGKAQERWSARHSPALEERTDALATMQLDEWPVPQIAQANLAEPPPIPPASPPLKSAVGYEVIVPRETAKGIPLKRELQTCVVSVTTDERHCDLTSWATATKTGDVLLKVQLEQLPAEPYTLLIANKKRGYVALDGTEFSTNATPFNGKFPRQRKITKILLIAGGMTARAGAFTLMSGNPIMGAGMGFGPPVARLIINHFTKKRLERQIKEIN